MVTELLSPQVSVLGSILISPELMGQALSQLRQDDFVTAEYRILWNGMCRLFSRGVEVDPVVLRAELADMGDYTRLIVECMECVPTAAHFARYVDLLKREALLERLRQIGSYMHAAETCESALDMLAKANEASISRPMRKRRNAAEIFRSFGARHAENQEPDCFRWPIDKLDRNIQMLHGDFAVIGGYPSDGKTAFALLCAWGMAAKGKRVGFYSLETSEDKIEDRSLAAIAKINMANIKHNTITDDEWGRYAESLAVFSEYPFNVIPAAGLTAEEIHADALANHYDVIFIDYLQLISPSGRRSDNRTNEVSDITRELHRCAQGSRIGIVALSQLTRPAARTDGTYTEPGIHSLRESGQIEQDADIIMLIYRVDQDDPKARRRLKVAKNKDGEIGRMWLDFDGQYQQFRYSDDQADKKPSIPNSRRKTHRTPVLSDMVQQRFYEISGEDKNLPF